MAAQRYADLTWALGGTTVATGSNTYTAIAQNVGSVFDTNTVAVFQPVRWQHQFDANGNLTVETSPLGGTNRCFAYDDENQLIAAWVTNVWKSEFVYDGLGRMRIKREYSWSPGSGVWVLGTDTRYIYDGMLVIQERGANGYPQVSYTRGKDLSGGMQGAGGIGGLLARTDHTQTSVLLKTAFYHADGNGNITALLSTNGLVLAWYQYSPFGTTLAQSGPLADANTMRFSSKMWHERTGLYYYGYRFYSPNLQRWINADPIQEAGGINLYGFVGNGPVGSLDKLGLSGDDVIKLCQKCETITDEMTEGGMRHENPYYNNICSSASGLWNYCHSPKWWIQRSFGCDGQSSYLLQALNQTITHDKWNFYFYSSIAIIFPHQTIIAVSNNPKDPILHLDPWTIKFEAVDPCDVPNKWHESPYSTEERKTWIDGPGPRFPTSDEPVIS